MSQLYIQITFDHFRSISFIPLRKKARTTFNHLSHPLASASHMTEETNSKLLELGGSIGL